MNKQLTAISLDDWAGIYDTSTGKLITQGHSIRYDEVLEHLGYKVDSHYIFNDTLDEFGNQLPDNLNEVLDYIKRSNLDV